MSNVSGGPGWWIASDGKWYPPSEAPASTLCPNGHPVTDGGAFCQECGAPVAQQTCPNGHPAVPGNAFCQDCGATMTTAPAQASIAQDPVPGAIPSSGEAAAPPAHKSRKKPLIIGGVAAAVVLVAVVGVVTLTGSSGSSYPANVQNELVSSLTKAGASKQNATCLVHWLESHVPLAQLDKGTNGKITAWLTQADISCSGGSPAYGALVAGLGAVFSGHSTSFLTSESKGTHTTSSGGSSTVYCTRTTTRTLGTCTSTAGSTGTAGTGPSTGGTSSGGGTYGGSSGGGTYGGSSGGSTGT